MVIYETRTLNGVEYDYAYSDEGRYLIRDGRQYETVYNPLGSGRTYEEGDPIPPEEGDAQAVLNILLGGPDDND